MSYILDALKKSDRERNESASANFSLKIREDKDSRTNFKTLSTVMQTNSKNSLKIISKPSRFPDFLFIWLNFSDPTTITQKPKALVKNLSKL